jgi:hypothetical protein
LSDIETHIENAPCNRPLNEALVYFELHQNILDSDWPVRFKVAS